MKTTRQILIIAGIILTAGTLAFAWNGYHMGGGYGHNSGYGHHMGSGHMMDYDQGHHMGPGYRGADLSSEEIKALNQERKDFMNKTRELRKEAFNTKIAIEKEVNSDSPDFNKVEKLRSELFEINNKITKIHDEYSTMTKMRKTGHGRHMMTGAGFNGNGYCW